MNSCYIFISSIDASEVILANYSHIIPIILSLFLAIFISIKAKFNLFSKLFLFFSATFAIWLIGDWITWTLTNYHLIYTVWSFLLYLEIIFYALGLYFALVFVRKSDIPNLGKVTLFILTLPALYLTVMKQSVTGFYQPTCEAFNNTSLDLYKLVYEGIILTIILLYALNPLFQKISWKERRASLVVLGSIFLFLATFGVTEYIAATTGNYEINLYSLFLLPVFLVAIIYAVFELDIFNFKILGTHYLVVGLMILMGGQLFFVTDTTNRLLTVLTIFVTVGLSFILFKNLKKESDQREQIVKLNIELHTTIQQRESLVHLVTHKVKGSFTRSKYIFAGILDGTFGETTTAIKKIAQQGLDSDNTGIKTVDLVLNVANMEKGMIRYEMKTIDLKEMVKATIAEKKVPAEEKGLKIENEVKDEVYNIFGDPFWIKEILNNLIENAIRYTKIGKITVNLEKKEDKVLISVKDTGVGIKEEDKKILFTEGGRGKDSVHVNIDSTGYGLYSVKLIADKHKGRVWAQSEGEGKGSTFFVELPTGQNTPTSQSH